MTADTQANGSEGVQGRSSNDDVQRALVRLEVGREDAPTRIIKDRLPQGRLRPCPNVGAVESKGHLEDEGVSSPATHESNGAGQSTRHEHAVNLHELLRMRFFK